MTRFIPAIAAALLTAVSVTPVFAQAAVQEPGLAAFYHPDADLLNGGRPSYQPLDANALYGGAVLAPRGRQRAAHYRAVRRAQ